MATKLALTSKHVQVDKAKAMMLGLLVGASAISMFALVASRSFYTQSRYLSKVSAEKEKAAKQLTSNKSAVSTLVASYKSFSKQDPNLLGGSVAGAGEHDGDNARLVLDALPSKYDFPALATSLEKLLTGYTISTISGSDDTISQDQAANSKIVEMPFSLAIETDYKGMQSLVTTFERSIRPFQIKTLEISGTNTKIQTNITAVTFYQPEKSLKIGTKVVK